MITHLPKMAKMEKVDNTKFHKDMKSQEVSYRFQIDVTNLKISVPLPTKGKDIHT